MKMKPSGLSLGGVGALPRATVRSRYKFHADLLVRSPDHAAIKRSCALGAESPNEVFGQFVGFGYRELGAFVGCVAQRAFLSWSLLREVDPSRIADRTSKILTLFGAHGGLDGGSTNRAC